MSRPITIKVRRETTDTLPEGPASRAWRESGTGVSYTEVFVGRNPMPVAVKWTANIGRHSWWDGAERQLFMHGASAAVQLLQEAVVYKRLLRSAYSDPVTDAELRRRDIPREVQRVFDDTHSVYAFESSPYWGRRGEAQVVRAIERGGMFEMPFYQSGSDPILPASQRPTVETWRLVIDVMLSQVLYSRDVNVASVKRVMTMLGFFKVMRIVVDDNLVETPDAELSVEV